MVDKNASTERIIAASQYAKEKEYWLAKLAGNLDKVILPYDRSLEGYDGHQQVELIEFEINEAVFTRLVDLSNGSHHRLFMVLVAAYVLMLYKYTNRTDISVGTSVLKQEIEADFINTVLTLRNQITKDMTFKELILMVKNTVLEAVENQNYPMDALLYHLGLASQEGEFPLFGSAILLENIHDQKYLSHLHLNMVMSFCKTDEVIKGKLEYNPNLYKQSTMERFIFHYTHLLHLALFHVDQKLSEFDLLTADEKNCILNVFNHTTLDYPDGKTLHQVFEEQVEQYPDYIAVADAQRSLTYNELNQQANRLARVLRRKKIGPDQIVGLMMDRSVETIIAILAILKAGGAYLPIASNLPESRVIAMLEDSHASILISKDLIIENFSFNNIQTITVDQEFAIRVTPKRPQITELDRLPFPNRSLVNYEKYNQYIGQALVKNAMTLQGTRGCPYNCSYCHKIWSKKHICRSAENIFAELKMNYDLGVRRFAFVDDIFNFDSENSRRFFQMIIDHGLDIQIFFPNGMRGDILTKDYIDLMVKAGTTGLALALETGSPRLQKVIGKHLNLDQLRENIEYITSQYPHIILELFSMHGFPTETEEEAMMTLAFIKSLKWIHFPYVSILKIYPNTDMEKLALENGISNLAIDKSFHLAAHELPETLPFDKSFTLKYQASFLNEYFLSKERLLHVLPYQMQALTEDEIVQKYNSYLPVEIKSFDDLLQFVEIERAELGTTTCLPEDAFAIPNLNQKLQEAFPTQVPNEDAIKVLLLDLSQFFSDRTDQLYDVIEPPLGLMYLMTYLQQKLGQKVDGHIAKSRIDFDSFAELRRLLDQYKPDVIGLRTLSYHRDFFHKTATVIHQWRPDIPIIAGGPYATSSYDTILLDRNIDLIVLREGEETFAELIETMIENGNKLPLKEVLETIDGVAFIPDKDLVRDKLDREMILIDHYDRVMEREDVDNLPNVNQSTDLAYVIYTSGSTGKPKGVMIEHKNVHNLILGLHQRVYAFYGHPLRVSMVAPFEFDASVQQIFGALLQGHQLMIIPEDARVDGDKLCQFFKTNKIDISDGTPTHIRILLESMKDKKADFTVRHFMIAGEVLPVKVAEKFLEHFPGDETRVSNIYGPTECCVDSTCYDIVKEELSTLETLPIGQPLPNEQIYMFSEENRLQPIGVVGELCIAGDGVARGYLNRPDLTSEKFVPNPFKPQEKMYRTGDLARWLEDGNIEFLGRIDEQVKIRGFRIELGEIESCLLEYDRVHEAVVVAKKTKDGQSYLCAYITGEEAISTLELREYIAKELPYYMIPAHFIQLDKIPLSHNGKVDRKALPEFDGSQLNINRTYIRPKTDTEKVIAEIWKDVLGVDEISINDNFFDLGGNSLNIVQVNSKLKSTFQREIETVTLFRFTTISSLAEYLNQGAEGKEQAKQVKEHLDLINSGIEQMEETLGIMGGISDD